MRPGLTTILLSFAVAALGAEQQLPRDPFPADFAVSPCAPEQSCKTLPRTNMPQAAFTFLALKLEPQWLVDHGDEVEHAFEPACRRHATCLANLANTFSFCDDVLFVETNPVCDRLFPISKGAAAHEQCEAFRQIYLLGVDQKASEIWREAKACAAKNPVTHTRPLDIWMVPPVIPSGDAGSVMFYALDPDTKVPVLANITIQDQTFYAPDNPTGKPATFYPLKLRYKFIRVPNAEGHTDLVPPMITLEATGYPKTEFRLPGPVPRMQVKMRPDPSKLRPGKNVVTIDAHDAATGEPVEARVMIGDRPAGETNTPFVVEIKRGKRPEIWVTSLFNKYGDVVVAKAR